MKTDIETCTFKVLEINNKKYLQVIDHDNVQKLKMPKKMKEKYSKRKLKIYLKSLVITRIGMARMLRFVLAKA